jgi:hypothetical protein
VLTEDRTDRQLIIGIQIGGNSGGPILLLPPVLVLYLAELQHLLLPLLLRRQ